MKIKHKYILNNIVAFNNEYLHQDLEVKCVKCNHYGRTSYYDMIGLIIIDNINNIIRYENKLGSDNDDQYQHLKNIYCDNDILLKSLL